MTVKKRIPRMPVCFISFFLYCLLQWKETKENMTPYEPRHDKSCLGTERWGGGRGEVFSSRFSSATKTEIFFSQSESQNIFFRTKQKQFFILFIYYFFFVNSIYARNVFFYIYTFVYFLNPIYMSILFICSCIHVSWIFGSECIWAATWQNQ